MHVTEYRAVSEKKLIQLSVRKKWTLRVIFVFVCFLGSRRYCLSTVGPLLDARGPGGVLTALAARCCRFLIDGRHNVARDFLVLQARSECVAEFERAASVRSWLAQRLVLRARAFDVKGRPRGSKQKELRAGDCVLTVEVSHLAFRFRSLYVSHDGSLVDL